MKEEEDPGSRYFNCTDTERAAFEAGIKLGSIYHQYVGAPLSDENISILEKAIEDGAMVQPFVKDVKVRIDRTKIRKKKNAYKYFSLEGEMLNVWLKIGYGDVTLECEMRYVEDLRYPLMYITKISTK